MGVLTAVEREGVPAGGGAGCLGAGYGPVPDAVTEGVDVCTGGRTLLIKCELLEPGPFIAGC